MGSRIPSHQLSSGLYVSGRPEQPKDKQPTAASRAVPYTGGAVNKSGELGKMFDIPVVLDHPPRRPSQHNSGSVRSGPNSGPLPRPKKPSSGPLPLQPTGLIVSGQPEHAKASYGSAVTRLSEEARVVSKAAAWLFLVAVVMGLLVGAFLMVAVRKPVILVAVAAFLAPLLVLAAWNCGWGRRGLLGFVRRFPDAELRGAIDGHYVKVTGVVTCGSIPLETSYQRIPRCVYVSTELFEYKGCGGKSANPKHHCFSWGSRYAERYVADFYISDLQSGLRALVKAGYGAKVAPFVEPAATVAEVTQKNKELSPSLLRWLAERNLSSDDRIMRPKESYIKEGNTVSVMGVVQRHDNVLMIVPSAEPLSTGCEWLRCLLPTYVEGLILTGDDDAQDTDVVPV